MAEFIVVHGPPCASKSEQSDLLIKQWLSAGREVSTVSIGDRLRDIRGGLPVVFIRNCCQIVSKLMIR